MYIPRIPRLSSITPKPKVIVTIKAENPTATLVVSFRIR
jgi:hypothetical protein